MRAVVFGGSGFLGSHVAEALIEAGHQVTVYDLRESPPLAPGQRFVQGDILDADAVARTLAGQEGAYNFAGLADLEEAITQPVETVRTNVLGNTILLQEAHRAGLKRFIYASSIYVAGHSGGFYRASKQACELYVEEFQRWYGLDYTILRYGSIYGRRADPNNAVLKYLTQAVRDRKVVVSGSGEELREYVHATDVARASVQILEPEFRNEHVVLTGHQAMRVKDLVAMIREIVGPDVQVEFQAVDPELERAGRSPHYTITPYSFRPRIAKKLVAHQHLDMGQGIIDLLEEIHERLTGHPAGVAHPPQD